VSEPAGWHRLHPLSPAVRAGRLLVAFAIVFLPTFLGGTRSAWDAGIHALAVGLLVVLGVVSWLVTRWRIEDDDLRIETGLIRRSSLRYPLSQVQAIDTVRPGLARIFGLAELRLRLRARLLALATGAHEDTPEAKDEVRVIVPVGRALASIVLSPPALLLLAYIAALTAAAVSGGGAWRAITAYAAPILIGDVAALWRRFNRAYRATVAEAPEGIRVRAGLVETSAETIPRGRVQAVRLLEPLLWRPFGWCRLDVDVAGRVHDRGGERRNERQLRAVLPVGSQAEARQLLELLVPSAPVPERRPPRRARWKSPLRYRRLSFAYDANYVVSTTGRLARLQDWVPLTKVQSVRRAEGPVQRRLGLATVLIDTAGKRFGAALRDVDGEGSFEDLERLTVLARSARRSSVAAGGVDKTLCDVVRSPNGVRQ
jgi:putative membrane protein